jgi:MFS family permease
MADTLKAQHTAHLTTGCVAYSDMGRVLFGIVDDSLGWHDPLCGLSDADLLRRRHGESRFQEQRNERRVSGREAMLVELGKYGLGERDLVANINFFSKVVVRDDTTDDRLWSLAYGGSMVLAALLSPLAGAAADERAWKKEGLVITGLVCGLFTCGLAFIQPGQIWLALLLYIPANFAFAIGENFLASFLPSLARQNEVGKVSGFSWGLAYFAALLLIGVTAGGMALFHLKSPEHWRPFFLMAGLWFLAFTLPVIFWLREPAVERTVHSGRSWLTAGFVRLVETVKHLRSYRDLAMLMAASFFFATGMSVVVSFASKLAGEYGFKEVQMVIFMAVITVSGIVGTVGLTGIWKAQWPWYSAPSLIHCSTRAICALLSTLWKSAGGMWSSVSFVSSRFITSLFSG